MATLEQCKQALIDARDNEEGDLASFYRSEMILTLAEYCSDKVKPLLQENSSSVSYYQELGGAGIAMACLERLFLKLNYSEQLDLVNVIESDLRLSDLKYSGLV